MEKNKKRTKKNSNIKGITLIALVVTIIVLLILAGIAINLTIGNNGLFSRAENAANTWRRAEENEAGEMKSFANTYDETLNNLGLNGSGNGGGESKTPINEITGNETNNTETTDREGNRVVVPAGFKVVNPEATVNEGIVIEDVSGNNGDTVGNQFVWILCEIETEENKDNGKLKYDRYAFTRDDWNSRQSLILGADGKYEKDENGSYKIKTVEHQDPFYFHEALLEDERISIEKYGGYYIGRYEVGVDSARSTSSKGNIEDVARIKSNLPVYNYVTKDESKTIAERMYGGKSKLCSSYAWDTALRFIDGENGTYAVNSIGDNCGTNKLENTGYHAEKNIYDMGGNVWEWTAEISTNYAANDVTRGGYYNNSSLDKPAGHRGCIKTDHSDYYIGYRVAFYM